MKTIFFLSLSLLFTSNICFSQEDAPEEGYVVSLLLKDSSVFYGYPNIKKNFVDVKVPQVPSDRNLVADGRDFGQTDNSFFCYDNEGKVQLIHHDKIESVNVTDGSFVFVRINVGGKIFWNKVVENEKYILYDNGHFFRVHNKAENKLVDIGYSEHSIPGKYGNGKDVKNFEKRIKPYFSDCEGFIKLIEKNLQLENYTKDNTLRYSGFKLFNGIADYQCD